MAIKLTHFIAKTAINAVSGMGWNGDVDTGKTPKAQKYDFSHSPDDERVGMEGGGVSVVDINDDAE